MQILHRKAFRMTVRLMVALNDDGGCLGSTPCLPRARNRSGCAAGSKHKTTEFEKATLATANKQFCHPERFPVKDLLLFSESVTVFADSGDKLTDGNQPTCYPERFPVEGFAFVLRKA